MIERKKDRETRRGNQRLSDWLCGGDRGKQWRNGALIDNKRRGVGERKMLGEGR